VHHSIVFGAEYLVRELNIERQQDMFARQSDARDGLQDAVA
jgi:hypothetical protein